MSYLRPVPNRLAVSIFRISNKCYKKKMFFFAYTFQRLNMMLNNIEIHPNALIGKNLTIAHSTGIVIGKNVTIGDNVKLYSSVVLGVKKTGEPGQPKVENNVVIGTGAKLLGNILIGENSIIGANAVVIENIDKNSLAVGNPAKSVRNKNVL